MRVKNAGFTLIELLIVVSIIGILSGVMVSVVDAQRQKKIAEDAVRRTNLEKLIEGIEAYYVVEGSYPLDENNDNNPMNDSGSSDDAAVGIYIKNWPQPADSAVHYNYKTNAGTSFAVYISKATDPTGYFKFANTWTAIRECGASGIDTITTCN